MSNETEQIYILNTSENHSSSEQKFIDLQLVQSTRVNLENVEDFSNVCRICATITEFVMPIFDREGVQNNLAEKIHKHLPIQVSKEDLLPRVVCYQCASTVLAWHELVQCCVQADAALRTKLLVLKETKDNKVKTVNIEAGQSTIEDEKKTFPLELQSEDKAMVETNRALLKPSNVTLGEDGRRYAECDHCNKNVSISSWRRHIRSHGIAKRYSCHTCGISFNDCSNLVRHRKALHGNQRPHACRVCSKRFSRKGHLEDHLRSHSESREFVCDVCGKASKSSAALRMHRQRHKELKHECMECGAKFKRRAELGAHVSVHTGERAHLCGCGRAFRLRGQLTLHARTHRKSETLQYPNVSHDHLTKC